MPTMVTAAVSPAMVGRRAELAELQDALGECRAGRVVTMLVGGEAGAGKTRLVSEFAATAADSDTTVLSGQCVELGSDGLAYAPVAGVVRSLAAEFGLTEVLGWAGAGAGALAGLLPEFDLHDSVGDHGRGRLFEVFTILLERAAARRPVLVQIEDLQWADASTRDLLRFAIRALSDSPILLVLTYRTDELTRTHPLRPFLAGLDRVRSVRRLTLPPLSEAEVGEQIAGIWGRDVPRDVIGRVHRRSEGLPFFVEELASAEDAGQTTGLSDSLRDLLLVRVEQLGRTTQELLRLMSVGGIRVGHPLLAAVCDLPAAELEDCLREAVSASVLQVDGDGYCFRHALLCEALQDDMLPGESARLHRRYADAVGREPGTLDRGAVAMQTAFHLFAAREYVGAFGAYLEAAAYAARTYAFPEAQLAYERALELWSLVPEPEDASGIDHATLLARTAEAAKHAGELERAVSLADAALRELAAAPDGDVEAWADLTQLRFRTLNDLGRPAPESELQDALDALPDDRPSEIRAALLTAIGARRMMSTDFPGAVEAATEAYRVATEAKVSWAQIKASTTLGSSCVHLGRLDEGLDWMERARTLPTDTPEARLTYNANLSDALCLLGRFREAATTAKEGIDTARELGRSRTLGALIIGNAAEPLIYLGSWDKAERMVDRGLELDPPVRHRWQLEGLKASLLLWRGQVDEADRVFGDLRSLIGQRTPDAQYAIPASKIAAEIASAQGDPETAWRYVEHRLEDSPRKAGYDLPLLGAGARAVRLLGTAGHDVTEHAARLRTELEVIGDWGPASAWRAFIEAELGAGDPAAWSTVLDREALPLHLRVYGRYRLAEDHLTAGDRSAAEAELRCAVDEAQRLGAGLIIALLQDLSRRGGLAGMPEEPDAQHHGHGLTPREVEVLRLVSAGRSNRQIGEELFISAKTASVHVSNILAKLGVSGRGEAAALAHDLLDAAVRRERGTDGSIDRDRQPRSPAG